MENTKTYTVTEDFFNNKVISYEQDGVSYSFTTDPGNSDYQAYLRWLENPQAEQSTPNPTGLFNE